MKKSKPKPRAKCSTGNAGKVATLEICRMALADCLPHERNPRQHPDPGTPQWETLKASLAHDYFDPLCWNRRNGKLVSGHLRRKVLVAEGYTHADVSVVDYDEPTHVARMIAANKLQGIDDLPQLKDLLAELDTGALDMNLTGWSEGELEMLMTAAPPEDAEIPLDRAAELNKKWGVKTGDLWAVGEHRLLCGDSTKREDVERVMGGEKAQAVLTDPVYGQDQDGVPGDSPEEMQRIVPSVCALLPTDNAVAVLFQSPRTFPVALDAMRAAAWAFNRCLWMYKQAQCVKPWRGWLLTSEAILVFSKGDAAWNECKPYSHDCYMMAELSGELAHDSGWHGSVKPLKVVADICQRISTSGGSVFDPFLGSGTTMIACENLKRKCRGIEISPAYCAVILERMSIAFPSIEIKRLDTP